MAGAAKRGLVALLVVAVVAVGAVFGVRALFREAKKRLEGTGCSVGNFTVSPDQASVASQMVGVVLRRELPERASVLVLAAALQESKLRNIPAGQGDRDSVGVLQQRPSQGWGSATQLADVRFATGAFLDALIKHDGWQTEPLADAIQQVQVSVNGRLYADDEPKAQALSDAFMGKVPAGITCDIDKPTKVAAAQTVADQLVRDLPVNTPTVTALTVTVTGAKWTTAAWFVANADRLGIVTVSYDGKVWQQGKGWADRPGTSAAAVVAVLAKV